MQLLYSEEWADALQRDYDEYMAALWDVADGGGDGDGIDITGEPFCGCDICERRASWTFLFLRVISAYEDGTVTLER